MTVYSLLYKSLSIAEIVNLSCGVLINSVLLYLIAYRSTKDIGNYRFLLFAFVLNDLFFEAIHIMTMPIACTFGDAFVIFATGVWSSRLSISYYAATFSQTLPLLMQLFIYRYFAMKTPQKTSLYTPLNTAVIVLSTVVVESNIWCWGSYFLYSPDPETRKYLQQFFSNESEGVEYLSQLYWIDDEFRVEKALITFFFVVLQGIYLAVIVYCSVAILQHFEMETKWSVGTKKLQKQLFHLLMIQLLIPMLFVYFPCAGIISFPMAHTGLNVFPNLVSFSLTIFPLLDAFIVIFGVKSYRKALFSLILPWGSRIVYFQERLS